MKFIPVIYIVRIIKISRKFDEEICVQQILCLRT